MSRPSTPPALTTASFDSGDQELGVRYTYTFTEPGTYRYFCRYHGDVGGVGMAGTILVE